MKPKDLIIKSLQEQILPKLSEFDFNFLKSSLKFSRKWNNFTQVINISPNRYNQEDFIVRFHTSFEISSKYYAQWHLKEYKEKSGNDSIAGEVDWNLKGWSYPKYKSNFKQEFDIAEDNDRERVLDILLSNIINIGIPYLEKYSDWKIGAERLIQKNWLHSKACDFYLIAGDKEKAFESLMIGQKTPNNQFVNEPELIRLRLKKHFSK